MIIDDKKRVIGKIISINSDRFSVELLSGTKNFNINGYDDIHYFAQINSYVIVPYQDYYIVAEVISVREKDDKSPEDLKEQELNKSNSTKYLDVLPIGRISGGRFDFGVSVYPTLYSDVLYIKDNELDIIFDVTGHVVPKCENCDNGACAIKTHTDYLYKEKTKLSALEIGVSAVFPDYDIKVDIDKFFGSHSAVLGNTGSGKSCTISSLFQTLFKKENFSVSGLNLIIFDVNGEYKQAFSQIKNPDIKVKNINIDPQGVDVDDEKLELPHYFLNIDEWELLLNASEKTQLPILRNALGLATLFAGDSKATEAIKKHILASCILETFNSSDSAVSKYQKIQALLARGSFASNIDDGYDSRYGNFSTDVKEETFISKINECLIKTNFEIPSFDNTKFDFNLLSEYLDLAILYEESHGNRQIRDYCSSLITRFKSLQERKDFSFIKDTPKDKTREDFISDILGIKGGKKETQITVINLNSAEDEIIELIVSVVTRLIFDKLRKVENRNQHPVNLVLEEAHRYISQDSKRNFIRANQIFDRVAKEGRKYGLFFLISSQRPSELSKTVLSQANNFIVHRIQNPDDLSHIRQITPHISESTLKKLPSIPTQHALIFGGAVNIPALFKVNKADPLPNSDNNKVSENWFINKDETITF